MGTFFSISGSTASKLTGTNERGPMKMGREASTRVSCVPVGRVKKQINISKMIPALPMPKMEIISIPQTRSKQSSLFNKTWWCVNSTYSTNQWTRTQLSRQASECGTLTKSRRGGTKRERARARSHHRHLLHPPSLQRKVRRKRRKRCLGSVGKARSCPLALISCSDRPPR